ncbi:MAG TPA: serine hydrolase domain-containing protein [Anaerolineaceae bacterium]|nr:serine hydrolase domain-containing protein [Anaerolineaceae bacterium]
MFAHSRLVVGTLLMMVALAACGTAASPAPTTVPPMSVPPTTVASKTATPSSQVKPITEVISSIDTSLTVRAQNKIFSGSVLISKNGKILLSKGYGLADQDKKSPNTPQTRFVIDALSKPFTAMGILILQNKGKLNVQDPICKYVKSCPAAWKAITIQQILISTSGLPDLSSFVDYKEKISKPMTLAQLINWFKEKPLDFQPGTKWYYSITGYYILEYIIEQVSGQSYATFLKENIFDPLNMTDTGTVTSGKDLAIGYQDYLKNQKADLYPWLARLYSSVEDLYKWDQSFNTEKLVPQNLVNEMLKAQVDCGAEDPGESYGYGWFIVPFQWQYALAENSNWLGYTQANWYFPNNQLTIIVLSNIADPAAQNMGFMINGLLYELL